MHDSELGPELGDTLPAAQPSSEAVRLLQLRRSSPADFLGEPGPDAHTLSQILTIAARAPDHRRVAPFRFIVFANEARARFGNVLREAFLTTQPGANEEKAAFEEKRFMRAPVVVAVISSVDKTHRTPEWEQILTSGAVCQNMLLAASAFGFAAQWITEWYAYDEMVGAGLELGENERVAGFIYLGKAREDPKERARPDVKAITRYY